MSLKAPLEECLGLLRQLGVEANGSGELTARSPISGETLASLTPTNRDECSAIIERANSAYLQWRLVPPPVRGELVRRFGDVLRAEKESLGHMVTLETGKILSEGLGEVQEMIDICTFAAGLSRQLHGLTIATERPQHRMMETWHPLGVTGIISAFNFPVAVWAWNAALAFICGNACVWKPSDKTPLCALAVQALFTRAAQSMSEVPEGLSGLLIGSAGLGEMLVDSPRVALVSATGSTAMGRKVAPRLAARFARSILELGGNNAAVVCPSADLHLALRAVAFSAMGTAGQRCTTLRRLFVHTSVYERLVGQLQGVYESAEVGDPRLPETLIGPLIDERAYGEMHESLEQAHKEGGTVSGGERVDVAQWPQAYYCHPALLEMPGQTAVVQRETFAPILYVMRYETLEEAIALNNDVSHGLASSIFTNDLREAEQFLTASGSDCGIVNVNIGPSGAEIGGAFGGEKDTGGGRESGSDVWKSYMRRATNTINYGSELPLAQGVRFDVH